MEAHKIIITGAATRMGAAIAKKLSGPEVEIVIHYNSSKINAEKLKKELIKNKTKVYLVKGDLSKENDLKKIINFSKSKLKYFDCLINNASLFENDNLKNFTSKSWNNHLDVNLKAPAYLAKEFAKVTVKSILIFLSLGFIMNLFEEINFFKDIDNSFFYPILLTSLIVPSLLYEMFPFIILISGIINLQ